MRDARLWYAPWLFPGQHASMAGLATSGTLTHWFREQLARELDPKAGDGGAREQRPTASPPGANGLVLLPYFSGERTPIHDPHAKGVIFGLNLTHTRADIYRALLEGIAFATNHIFETYSEAGAPPKAIRAVGGGTRNRDLDAGDLRRLRARAGGVQDLPRRVLRRRLSRSARRRRRFRQGDQDLEPGRDADHAHGRQRGNLSRPIRGVPRALSAHP